MKQLEVFKLGQERWYWAGDISPFDEKVLEFCELRNTGLDWADKFRKLMEFKILEVRKVTNGRWYLAR